VGAHSTDSGTTQRVLSTLLTWLSEKVTPVFVIATANNIHVLPPELMRKGRFDDIFFVDLPDEVERSEIFAIHLARRNRDPKKFNIAELSARSAGLSGAEIEQAIVAALFEAFSQRRDINDADIAKAMAETVPLSKTMDAEINALREWAMTRARHASIRQEEIVARATRKMEL
jgi:SpoVK/Ycf46/Vps4 family AAA+-type ATPase